MHSRMTQKQRWDKSILLLFSQMLGKQRLAFNEYLICREALRTQREQWDLADCSRDQIGIWPPEFFLPFLPLIFLKLQAELPQQPLLRRSPHSLPLPHPQVLRNGRLGRGPPRLHCSQLWRSCCLWSLSSECTYSAMTSETQWPPQAAGRTGCRAVFVTAAQTLVLAHVSLGQSLVGRSTRPSRQAAPREDWTVEGVQ